MPARQERSPVARAATAARRLAQRVGTGADEPHAQAPAVEKPRRPSAGEREQEGRAERAVRGEWRLLQSVLGRTVIPETPIGRDPDPETVTEAVSLARRARALSAFADALARGEDLRVAYVATVRALCDAGLRPTALAFLVGAEPLVRDPSLSALGRGVVLHSLTEHADAWAALSTVGVDDLAALAPVEAVTCALAVGTPEAVALARAVGERSRHHEPAVLVELSGRLLATGHTDLARSLVEEAETRDLDEATALVVEGQRRWTHPGPAPEVPPGRVSLAVIDYHQPDHHRASRNVGDYVQTLAMLGNLVRFRDTRFHGADGLGDLLTELQGRVREDLRLPGGAADVEVLPVSRDFSAGDQVPEGTWMIAFGWHLHSTFRIGFGLPYHPHLRPVFLSFHLNRVRALTPEVLDYLRRHGPIGCRDWTTVDLLLSAGVDAFFTGCLTTTVDAVFPPAEEDHKDPDQVVGAVDLKPAALAKIKGHKEVVTHAGLEFRDATLAGGTRAALELLSRYRRRFRRVVTTRLHSYLPATSLGIPVKFRPPIDGDVRFDGLLGMRPGSPELAAVRDGVRALLADVHGWILSGLAAEEVYARWRERTAPLVAQARERWAAPPPAYAPVDPDGLPTGTGPAAVAGATHVAVSVDPGTVAHLPTTLASVVANASRPVHVTVLARGIGHSEVALAPPGVPLTLVDCTGLDQHPSLDRLLLPALLADVDRAVVLEVDTVTEGDVAQLAATDLGGHPLAARADRLLAAEVWREAGDALPPQRAFELRRTMSARHAFDLPAVAPGVLVLDLARMRADDVVGTTLAEARHYRLDARAALTAYAGSGRAPLPARWCVTPPFDEVDDPALVHFARVGAPWGEEPVPGGDRWRRYETPRAAREAAS